jgi:hypothetical protein
MAKQKVSRQIVEKRIEESMRTMKTFHGIVSGLALTAGILAIINRSLRRLLTTVMGDAWTEAVPSSFNAGNSKAAGIDPDKS